jgi:hypothetical protein
MKRIGWRVIFRCALIVVATVFARRSFAQTEPSVPDNLKPPSGQRLMFRGHATGVQIYTCQTSAGGSTWQLTAPDAKLVDDTGKEIATHFAGPTWQSPDGSLVKGKVVSQSSPDAEAIPWLLLTAVEHNGTGVMNDVSFIQRLNTKGGKALVLGCDSQHQGAKVQINYTADYYFYAPGK